MSSVTISPVRRSDGEELVRLNLANRDYHRPWSEPFTDIAGFETWLERTFTEAQRSFVARAAADGAVVGVLTISRIELGPLRSAYLGFYGMRDMAGRGYMTEALLRTVAWGFDEIRLNRMEANIQAHNARSIALVRRVGFQLEGFSPRYLKVAGEWRDHERWAILNPAGGIP